MQQDELGVDLVTPLLLKPDVKRKWSVKVDTIKAGTKLTVCSMRNSIFMGVPPLSVKFTGALRVHKLYEGNSLWASDIPQEIYTQWLAHRDCYGQVLIGGLGLGLAATQIALRKNVSKVTIIEKSKDVIDLVEPQLDAGYEKMEIIHDDVYRYLSKRREFDSAYFDIWAPTGESVWQEHIVPLRRLIWKVQGKRVVTAWCEEEMRGQMRHGFMYKPEGITLEHYRHWRPNWVFAEAAELAGLEHGSPKYRALLEVYLTEVGSPKWERLFRWDSWRKP